MVLVDGGGGDKVEGGEAAVQLGVVLQAAVRGTEKQEKKGVFLFFLSSRVLSLSACTIPHGPFRRGGGGTLNASLRPGGGVFGFPVFHLGD